MLLSSPVDLRDSNCNASMLGQSHEVFKQCWKRRSTPKPLADSSYRDDLIGKNHAATMFSINSEFVVSSESFSIKPSASVDKPSTSMIARETATKHCLRSDLGNAPNDGGNRRPSEFVYSAVGGGSAMIMSPNTFFLAESTVYRARCLRSRNARKTFATWLHY